MFNRSRRNIARWFTLSMGSILITFAGVVYYLRAEDNLESLDRLLYNKAKNHGHQRGIRGSRG